MALGIGIVAPADVPDAITADPGDDGAESTLAELEDAEEVEPEIATLLPPSEVETVTEVDPSHASSLLRAGVMGSVLREHGVDASVRFDSAFERYIVNYSPSGPTQEDAMLDIAKPTGGFAGSSPSHDVRANALRSDGTTFAYFTALQENKTAWRESRLGNTEMLAKSNEPLVVG